MQKTAAVPVRSRYGSCLAYSLRVPYCALAYMARRCDPYFTLDFADSTLPVMLFRPVSQTAAL